MAFLWLANKCISYIERTIAPNTFLPANTKAEKVIGSCGKYIWETIILSYDAKLLSIITSISFNTILMMTMDKSNRQGMGFAFHMSSAIMAGYIYPYILFGSQLLILGRIGKGIYTNKLQVTKFK